MALFDKATEKSAGGNGQKMEAPLLALGGYPAVLIRIVDLGEQPGSAQYPDPSYKMALVFECLDEFMVDEEGKSLPDVPREFDMEVSYNLDGYMSPKAKLHGVMTALEGFDKSLNELLGTVCTINLIQKATKADATKKYNAISGVAAMREKDKERYPGPFKLEQWVFNLDANTTKEDFEKQSSRGGQYSQQSKIKGALSLHKDAPQLAAALGVEAPKMIDHGADKPVGEAGAAFDEEEQNKQIEAAMGGAAVPTEGAGAEPNPFD
ncbi:hypothetical protein AH6C_068 [Aeromonas phage pAh6-C]|uniref:Uncharacterized protein n=1 Tax=Aeromonas phage pAh6-C TaxID=1505227 RepID=A0A076G5P3_9CAUD|nr:hypothetical protein AH6C_068 [Aeromonas phage pAh6-C]AII26822.1 hypothetical protein AH6C_068 [Aeromonas phage pAh6-C]